MAHDTPSEPTDETLDKIIAEQEADGYGNSPEAKRREYEEQEGKEAFGIPRPSADGDDADDEDDREP
jgi:hypothetical protein